MIRTWICNSGSGENPYCFVLSLLFSNLMEDLFENTSMYLVGNQTVKAGKLNHWGRVPSADSWWRHITHQKHQTDCLLFELRDSRHQMPEGLNNSTFEQTCNTLCFYTVTKSGVIQYHWLFFISLNILLLQEGKVTYVSLMMWFPITEPILHGLQACGHRFTCPCK